MKTIKVEVVDPISKKELDVLLTALEKIDQVTYVITFRKDITWTK